MAAGPAVLCLRQSRFFGIDSGHTVVVVAPAGALGRRSLYLYLHHVQTNHETVGSLHPISTFPPTFPTFLASRRRTYRKIPENVDCFRNWRPQK